MKKLATLICGLMLVSLPLCARTDIFDSGDNEPHLGVRLALDISCPTDIHSGKGSADIYNNAAGFELGGVYTLPLWQNLYFEPGIYIFYNTMKIDVPTIDSSAILDDTHIVGSTRRFGFRAPLLAGYRFDFEPVAISVFTGPVLSVGLVGRTHTHNNPAGIVTIDKSENCYADYGSCKRTDVGWRFGAGGTWGNYVVQLYGTVGMLNMLKNGGGAKYRDNNVAIALGYNF